MQYICCTHKPIMVDGSLAYVCEHDPGAVYDLFGYSYLRNGRKLHLSDFHIIGTEYTDAFGVLTNYTLIEKG